jgi:hypothetical protein
MKHETVSIANYDEIIRATNQIIQQYRTKLTVRQIYYRLISPPFQLFANTTNNYKGFDHLLTMAREKDDVDWTRIEDRARDTYGPAIEWFGYSIRLSQELNDYEKPQDFLHAIWKQLDKLSEYYTRSLWEEQPKYVEVWVEKDALSGLFIGACETYNTLVFPSRGYSSYTKVMEAVERFPNDKEIFLLHFADHDPSGIDMTRDVERRLTDYGSPDFTMQRIGLTIEQVRDLNLPSTPTKVASQGRKSYLRQFGDECWELDAVPPDILEQWIKDAIDEHVDFTVWNNTKAEIELEKQKIKDVIANQKPNLQNVLRELLKEL